MHYFSPKEHHNFIKSQSTDVKKQITANGTSNKAKSIQACGSLQACGGLQVNGDLQANGGLQANGDLQSQGTHTAHTKTKLTSISESDFDFDHVYDYIDHDSDDDDYIWHNVAMIVKWNSLSGKAYRHFLVYKYIAYGSILNCIYFTPQKYFIAM